MELPPKNLVEHKLKLDDNERKVYDEVFSFSQQAMLNYMQKQDQDKEDAEYIKKAQEDYYKFDPKVSKKKHFHDFFYFGHFLANYWVDVWAKFAYLNYLPFLTIFGYVFAFLYFCLLGYF